MAWEERMSTIERNGESKLKQKLPTLTSQDNGIKTDVVTFTLNFMAPFYGWGSTASRLVPLRGGSLLFTTKFSDISGTHFIDLGKMKDWVDLGATQWIWTRDPWIGNPAT